MATLHLSKHDLEALHELTINREDDLSEEKNRQVNYLFERILDEFASLEGLETLMEITNEDGSRTVEVEVDAQTIMVFQSAIEEIKECSDCATTASDSTDENSANSEVSGNEQWVETLSDRAQTWVSGDTQTRKGVLTGY